MTENNSNHTKVEDLQQALNDITEKHKVLSETVFEGVFITENGYCIEGNAVGCELLGYNSEEIIGLFAADIVIPEHRELALSKIKEANSSPFEITFVRKDGSEFYAQVQTKDYPYKGRRVKVVVVRDVSDHKKMIQDLLTSEKKYRAVVENAGDGIIVGDTDGRMIDINDAFLAITKFSKEELINKHITTIFSPDSLNEEPLRFDLLNVGQTVIIERNIIGKDGESIPIEMNSKKPDENYYLSIFRDLRERKKAEDNLKKTNNELRLAKEKAEDSDRLKSSFLTNMSHEIRTPMNGIIGFAELLKKQELDREQRDDYLNIILASGQQLLNIINDVLEISKIETGHIKVESVPFDILSMLKEIISFFKPIAERGHNTLTINTTKCNMAILSGDPAKIQQVLTNLINNSLKFTEAGHVEIGIATYSGEIMFYVKDDGIGIPEEYISTIFDRFTQAQHPGINKQKGTGLGLSICKKLVDIMNGNIWVESTVGEGTTFYFVIPFMET